MVYKFTLLILTTVLLVAGCRMAPPDAPRESAGVISTLTVDGQTMKLAHAYARRKRVFFDEPDELIEVMVTEKAYPAAGIPTLFDKRTDDSPVHGIVLIVANNPAPSVGIRMRYRSSSPGDFTPTGAEIGDFSITKGAISGRSEKKREDFGKKWSYTLRLDVLFKG